MKPKEHRAKTPKCLIFPHTDEQVHKSITNQCFSTPHHRRARAAHLKKRIPSYGFEGRPVARRNRRREKRAPLREAREPSRLRAWPNTQNHCKVLRFRTRNSYHLPRIITTRTPFSPDRMRKRCKGCHFARATERHRTEMTQMRQGPPPGPQPPDPPFRSRRLAKAGPGGGGAVTWVWTSPLPPLALFTSSWPNEAARTRIKPTTDARRPRGAADFPCLRQLPPPPELQCGHERRRRDLGRRERRGRHMCAEDAHAEYAHMCMSADDARWRICAENAHVRG